MFSFSSKPTDAAKTQEEAHKEWVSYFHNRVPLVILLLNLSLGKISISPFPFNLDHFALFLDIVRRQDLNTRSVTSLLRIIWGDAPVTWNYFLVYTALISYAIFSPLVLFVCKTEKQPRLLSHSYSVTWFQYCFNTLSEKLSFFFFFKPVILKRFAEF